MNRDPEIRRRRKAGTKIKLAGVPRGEFDEMMGYLCLCPPAVCRPSATYSCRPRSSDADNLGIFLLSNSYRAISQENVNDKYDFDPQDDLIDQLHLDMGRIYATLRSSHGLASSRRWRAARPARSAPSWPSLSASASSAAPSRWCTVPASRQLQGGGVLDGGDSPHEPRLHGVHAQAREGL